MTKNETGYIPRKKKPKFKKLEKFFFIAVLSGTVYLIVHGFKAYEEIMNNPNIVKGVVYNKKLSSTGNNNYYWDIYYRYLVEDEFYQSKLIDHSPFSKDFSIGDSLYVYVDRFDYKKSLASKIPINVKLRPNILSFMLHDSTSGFLLILVLLVILVFTLPVFIDLLFVLLIGTFLKFFNKNKSEQFFERGLNRLKDSTLNKIDSFIERW